MKKIYAAANLQEAHLISHLLHSYGIAHHILNEGLQGGLGELPFTHTYPEIWLVDEDEAGRALEVIRTFEQPAASGRAAACPSCGEENPPAFEVCWRCGRALE